MLKLIPIYIKSPYMIDIYFLLMMYGRLIFSEFENPFRTFFYALLKNEIKVIGGIKNGEFIAFCTLYNLKKMSENNFSCYIYGCAKRKNSKEIDEMLSYIFDDLKKQGCKVVRLETRIYNMPMRMLARRLNFRKIGVLKKASFDKT